MFSTHVLCCLLPYFVPRCGVLRVHKLPHLLCCHCQPFDVNHLLSTVGSTRVFCQVPANTKLAITHHVTHGPIQRVFASTTLVCFQYPHFQFHVPGECSLASFLHCHACLHLSFPYPPNYSRMSGNFPASTGRFLWWTRLTDSRTATPSSFKNWDRSLATTASFSLELLCRTRRRKCVPGMVFTASFPVLTHFHSITNANLFPIALLTHFYILHQLHVCGDHLLG